MRRIAFASMIAASLSLACGGNSESDGATGGTSGNGGSGGSGGKSGAGGTGGAAGASGSSGSAGAVSSCGDPAWKTCNGPAQCVLATDNCCLCGTPELVDFEAIHQSHLSECTCVGPACGCAAAPNPNLAASCENGQCLGWDVRTSTKYAACTDATECKLRMGLECCEGCQSGEWGLIAMRSDAESALQQAVCAPNTACDACVPTYPPNATAQCIGGFCQVVIAL